MKARRIDEAKGVILIAAGLMLLLSLVRFAENDLGLFTSHPNNPPINLLGIFGAYLGGAVIFIFGKITSYLVPFLVIFLGIKFFRQQSPYLGVARLIGIVVLLVSISALVGMFYPSNVYIRFNSAGLIGSSVSRFVTSYFSPVGSFIILATFIILSLALTTEALISSLFKSIGGRLKSMVSDLPRFGRNRKARLNIRPRPAVSQDAARQGPKKESLLSAVKAKIDRLDEVSLVRPKIQIKSKPPAEELKPKQEVSRIGDYRLPPLELLDSPPPLEARKIEEDLEANARILEDTLEDFGISAKVTDIERGPVITRYELDPAPGVKLNRIVTLSDDIALAIKAQSVRIIAPIPGKGRVGVEVPNMQSSFVYLKEVLESPAFQQAKSILTLALGKDISGKPIVADLDDMPHLLIAGTTGSGKTVCVNSLILSLLFKNSPNELKFLMIDPKMVELMPFNGLPHMLCPVVTDAKKASIALGWVVNEMEDRYRLLAKAGVRNIESYNEKQEKIPYMIVVIDEFADLMTVARDQIENAITRLAQLSRAVGIHLMLATQRPSVDVITGVIKANLPARISFKVASKVDSRTVLDMNGADKLLGKGDMLFLKPGEEKLNRIQCTLVKDSEIEKVVEFIKTQGQPVYDEEVLKENKKGGIVEGDKDDIYEEAVRIIMESNQASVSILQRRLRLGYTRAARIIDVMEQEGLVGPYEGSKPRKILIDREVWIKENILPQEQGSNQ